MEVTNETTYYKTTREVVEYFKSILNIDLSDDSISFIKSKLLNVYFEGWDRGWDDRGWESRSQCKKDT